ncbi:MAG: TolC family protein [Alphaproteobacteria bacterium]
MTTHHGTRVTATILAMTLALAFGHPPTAWAGEHAPGGHAHGAGIADLLELARTLNPEVAAMRLEADAAAARVDAEGSLADPKFRVSVEDLPRDRPGYAPRLNPGQVKYTLSQDLPFFGKRGLKEDIAAAEARAAAAAAGSALNEVLARVKVAYAEYHQAHLAMEQTSALIDVMATVTRLAQLRYGQGLGSQQEAASAELERSAMVAELARLEATRYKARARLNALVNRAADAPLVEEPHPRTLPPPAALDYAALMERAHRGNPRFAESDARISGADKGRELADLAWYPDFGIGLTAVQRQGASGIDAYETMLEMNIPLQGGLRQSQQQAAVAMAAAARARRDAAMREIDSGLHEAYLALHSARKVEKILAENTLPQGELAFRSVVKSYELGRSGLIEVLGALQRLRRTQIEQLNAFYEQQVRLAEIERLVGADL